MTGGGRGWANLFLASIYRKMKISALQLVCGAEIFCVKRFLIKASMKQKLSLALAMVLMLSLAVCGGNDTPAAAPRFAVLDPDYTTAA